MKDKRRQSLQRQASLPSHVDQVHMDNYLSSVKKIKKCSFEQSEQVTAKRNRIFQQLQVNDQALHRMIKENGSQKKKKKKPSRLTRLSQNVVTGRLNACIDTLNIPMVILGVLLVLGLLIGYKSMLMEVRMERRHHQKSHLQITHHSSVPPREYSELAQKVYLAIQGGETMESVKQSTQDTYGYA